MAEGVSALADGMPAMTQGMPVMGDGAGVTSALATGEAVTQQIPLSTLEAPRRESLLDPLLHVWNRAGLEALVERANAAALAGAAPFLVLMIDIDYFRRINEGYGTLVGDAVLKMVLRALRGSLGAGDEIGRWAADKFLLVLTNMSVSSGERLARRLNDAVSALRVETSTKSRGCPVNIGCTVSIGIAEWVRSVSESAQSLIGMADAALLQAKRRGRNCARVGRRTESVQPS
jgi:diguanylate cyclase (GGDEF)-like protein